MLISIFSWFFHTIFKDLTEQILSKMQQNASFCILLKYFSIFSWFYHTIFKVLTTQILYPKCSRMHHFASWKKKFRPILVSRGLACMTLFLNCIRKRKHAFVSSQDLDFQQFVVVLFVFND